MRKSFIFLFVVWLTFPISAEAAVFGDTINNNQTYNQPAANATAQGGQGGQGGSATIQKGAVTNDNNVNVGNGIGNFSPSAKSEATIERGAVQNTNSNRQEQAQHQTQQQGQKQSQNNNQTVAPVQTTQISQVYEEKRELPNIPTGLAPSMFAYRGPFEKGVFDLVQPWTDTEKWTQEILNGFPSSFFGTDVTVAKYLKRDATTQFSIVSSSSKPLACLILAASDNPLVLWKKVATAAMEECGATEVKVIKYRVTFSNKASGWNIGLGGGVTAINGGNDNYGGAVGGGTGFGSVESTPVEKCQAAFAAY
jgi:hypothetical protein